MLSAIGKTRNRYPGYRFHVYTYYPRKNPILNWNGRSSIISAALLTIITLLFPLST
jgi:hypothetical protein